MSMSSIHVFDGGVIPDSESSGGSSGSANIKNLIMRDFDLNLGGETVSSKILCDYDSPQQSSPYYTPVSIEDMAQWTHDGFVMQVRLESQPSIAANLGFLARVSISNDSIEDEVTNAKVFTYERLDDHRIKFNILNFDKVTDEVTSIDYLKLSGMDEFILDSSIDMTIADILDKIPNTASASNKLITEQQLEDATASMASGYTPKGPASVSTLNGLTEKENGDQYIVTNSGTLTDGSLSVIAGESVAWDSVNEEWYKVNQYALKRFGTNEVKNLPTAITSFRTGDVIAVDGPNGTAKMSKDDLLKEASQNALAGNIAPAFDPTRTSENPYIAYKDFCVLGGAFYLFIRNHYGAWNGSDAVKVNVSQYITDDHEETQSQETSIELLDSDGTPIAKLESYGCDFRNLKSNGKDVITDDHEETQSQETSIELLDSASNTPILRLTNSGLECKSFSIIGGAPSSLDLKINETINYILDTNAQRGTDIVLVGNFYSAWSVDNNKERRKFYGVLRAFSEFYSLGYLDFLKSGIMNGRPSHDFLYVPDGVHATSEIASKTLCNNVLSYLKSRYFNWETRRFLILGDSTVSLNTSVMWSNRLRTELGDNNVTISGQQSQGWIVGNNVKNQFDGTPDKTLYDTVIISCQESNDGNHGYYTNFNYESAMRWLESL